MSTGNRHQPPISTPDPKIRELGADRRTGPTHRFASLDNLSAANPLTYGSRFHITVEPKGPLIKVYAASIYGSVFFDGALFGVVFKENTSTTTNFRHARADTNPGTSGCASQLEKHFSRTNAENDMSRTLSVEPMSDVRHVSQSTLD